MTLHSIGQTLWGRRQLRRSAVPAGTRVEPANVALGLPGAMRILEAGLAFSALVTALLLGLGR